jgi:hypothetical protein
MQTTLTNTEIEVTTKGGSIEELNEMPSNIQGNIDISLELGLLDIDLIKSALRIDNANNKLKLYIGNDRINIYESQKGYKYFKMNKKHYISGALRFEIIKYLYNSLKPEYIGKLGKYEILKSQWNGKEFYFWLNIENQSVEFISNKEAIENSATVMTYKKLKEEKTIKSNPQTIKAEDEIYGNIETSLGYLAVSQILEELERTKELISQAKQYTHLEVKELLDEIKEMLE